jgi:RNA polymerase sigma-70 factor, ECF subfamily
MAGAGNRTGLGTGAGKGKVVIVITIFFCRCLKGRNKVDAPVPFEDQLVSHAPRLRAFARKARIPPDEQEDYVQEALTKGLEFRHQYIQDTNLFGWLSTIMINLYRSRKRREFRLVFVDPMESSDDENYRGYFNTLASSVPPVGTAGLELQDAVRALKLMPKHMRQAIVLVNFGATSYESASVVLGIAEGTVKSRVARGLRFLHLLMNSERLWLAPPEPNPMAWLEWELDSLMVKAPSNLRIKDRSNRGSTRAIGY